MHRRCDMEYALINSRKEDLSRTQPFLQDATNHAYDLFMVRSENSSNSFRTLSGGYNEPMENNDNFIVLVSVATNPIIAARNNEYISIYGNFNKNKQFLPKLTELLAPSSASALNTYKTKEKAYFILTMTQCLEKDNERLASRYIMGELENFIKYKQISNINELLTIIENYNLRPRALVSILRSTYRAKDFLPGWKHALIHTQNKIELIGQSSKAWLVGLINA